MPWELNKEMTNDIFDVIGEGAKWLAAGGRIYIVFKDIFSEEIKNQEDLERMILEEKSKLNINRTIKPTFFENKFMLPRCRKNKMGNYEIDIGNFGANRSSVRHELYHIHREI